MTELPPLKTTVPACQPDLLVSRRSWTGVELFGRYVLGPRVGAGGFGVVYRAEDTVLHIAVAVKVLHSAHPAGIDRLKREIAALRQLNLPGVVHFLDSGVHEGTPFFVMEFVEGSPFPGTAPSGTAPSGTEPSATALSGNGRLSEDDSIRSWQSLEPVVVALLEALSRLHRRGYVHRDLKPQNVLVDDRGVPTILDFGLAWCPELGARLTDTGRFIGTPAYLAPEQHGGNVVERRADLFSLGVMIYETLTGKLPFPGTDLMEIALHKANTIPEPLHHLDDRIPRRVSDLVGRLLASNPLARPADAAEVLGVLRGECGARSVLPWLDTSSLRVRFRRALYEHASFDITGGPGSGLSRALEECAQLAESHGLDVRFTVAADSPFASLETVFTASRSTEKLDRSGAPLRLPEDSQMFSGGANLPFEEKAIQVRAQLDQLLASGIVLLVDEGHRIDQWSADVIEQARGGGVVIRVALERREGAHLLKPLSASALRVLFRGCDRVFHIREDAAEQLFLRTDGIPELVHEELAAWERAGLCERSGGLWSIKRSAIDQLSVGFETASSLRVSRMREQLTREQGDLLAWIDLSFPHACAETLANLTGDELWRVEAQLVELGSKNLVRVTTQGTYGALATGLALQVWDLSRVRAAHRSLAEQLPRGSANRIFHLLEGQSGEHTLEDVAADEVVSCGKRLIEEERLGEAIAALSNGLKFVRAFGLPEQELAILEVWAMAAARTGELSNLETVQRELVINREKNPRLALLSLHVELWISALEGGGEELIDRLLSAPRYEEELVERNRLMAMVIASRSLSPEREGEVLDSLPSLVSDASREWCEKCFYTWCGQYLFRRGEYARSAAMYEEAAGATRSIQARAAAWVNSASGLTEIGEWEKGRKAVGHALECLESRRDPPLELRCLGLRRKLDYSEGRKLRVDLELVEIAREVGSPAIVGPIILNEAAIAWRSGDRKLSGEYAVEVAELWERQGRMEPAALARALARNCGADTGRESSLLLEAAVTAEVPGVGAQILALLAGSGVQVDRVIQREYCRAIPQDQWSHRREILSISECAESLD